MGQQNPQPEAADFDPADPLRRSGTSNRSFKSVSPGYGTTVPVVLTRRTCPGGDVDLYGITFNMHDSDTDGPCVHVADA